MSRLLITLLLLATPLTAAADVITVTDNDILPGATVNWTSDNTYILDGFVFVDEGATLNIEAGTVVKGKSGQGEDASALIICRGAQIFAQGTATSPIIFTGEADDVTVTDDIDPNATKLWGGLIILGRATNNAPGGEGHIEGIPETEPRGSWGGADDTDNSGVLRYVSIRHGGSIIGANNEINGLSLGAVGSGTTIEYIEVFSNADDGFEFFGGTVNTKYLASVFNQDDSFDTDEGFRGKGQFWFALQSDQPELADCLTEQDGGTSPEDALPWSRPQLYNLTLIGNGQTGSVTSSQLAMNLRDNTAGTWANSIVMAHSGQAISIETPSSGVGSVDRLEAGDLMLLNNIWYDFGAGDALTDIAAQEYTANHLQANANTIANPMLRGISYTADGGLDPRPSALSPAYSNLSPIPEDVFFTDVNYKGAFGGDNWLRGWTALDAYGFLTEESTGANIVTVTDNDILTGQTVNWTSDNTYILDGFVFVEEGATLNIEAGTVVKGKSGQGEDASALIICRGAQIFAQGTATSPIIFTGEADDVTVTDDIDPNATKLWGGLILLGCATNNAPGGEGHIEGIPETEPRGSWGGTDDTDNSGVLRYVSIRHGGSIIGANNEINGLSLGAVGSGTTIEYIEVFSNADDGFEFFGGTVNTKYLASVFNQDDSIDTDEGFRGKGQFWFALQSDQPELADCLTEQDGGTSPEDALPWSRPQLYNLTLIGNGQTGPVTSSQLAMNLRDNTAGTWANSIVMAHSGQAISIETPSSGVGSVDRLEAGDLKLLNNIWYGFGAGDAFTDIAAQEYTANHLQANANTIANPMLAGISYTADAGLDPRPEAGGNAYVGLAAIPEDGFFTQVNYKGAFGSSNWLRGWTALDAYGYLAEDEVLVEEEAASVPEAVGLLANYPNPFNPVTSISFNLNTTGPVSLTVFDALGRKVDTLIDRAVMTPGVHSIQWHAGNHASGIYFYRLEAGNTMQTGRMTLIK